MKPIAVANFDDEIGNHQKQSGPMEEHCAERPDERDRKPRRLAVEKIAAAEFLSQLRPFLDQQRPNDHIHNFAVPSPNRLRKDLMKDQSLLRKVTLPSCVHHFPPEIGIISSQKPIKKPIIEFRRE